MTVFFAIIKKSTLFSGRKGGFRQIVVGEKIAEKVGFGGFFGLQVWFGNTKSRSRNRRRLPHTYFRMLLDKNKYGFELKPVTTAL